MEAYGDEYEPPPPNYNGFSPSKYPNKKFEAPLRTHVIRASSLPQSQSTTYNAHTIHNGNGAAFNPIPAHIFFRNQMQSQQASIPTANFPSKHQRKQQISNAAVLRPVRNSRPTIDFPTIDNPSSHISPYSSLRSVQAITLPKSDIPFRISNNEKSEIKSVLSTLPIYSVPYSISNTEPYTHIAPESTIHSHLSSTQLENVQEANLPQMRDRFYLHDSKTTIDQNADVDDLTKLYFSNLENISVQTVNNNKSTNQTPVSTDDTKKRAGTPTAEELKQALVFQQANQPKILIVDRRTKSKNRTSEGKMQLSQQNYPSLQFRS